MSATAGKRDLATMSRGDLIAKAEAGDRDAFQALTERHPDVIRARPFGFAGELALTSYKDAFVPRTQLVSRASLDKDIEAIQQDLGYSTASPLERLLIERICVVYLALSQHELLLSQNGGKVSVSTRDRWEHRASVIQGRYVQAIKALAQVRRLQLPNVQINVGEKQINVAGNLVQDGEKKGFLAPTLTEGEETR